MEGRAKKTSLSGCEHRSGLVARQVARGIVKREEEGEDEEEATLQILSKVVNLGVYRLLQRRHADAPEELDCNSASRPVLEHDTRLPFLHVLDQLQGLGFRV